MSWDRLSTGLLISGTARNCIRSLDSYLTIQPKQASEEVLVSVGNEGVETQKRLDSGGVQCLVPKAGFEPAHPCGR